MSSCVEMLARSNRQLFGSTSFPDRVALRAAALETGFDVPYGLLAGGSLVGVTRRTQRYAWPLSVPEFAPWIGSQHSTASLGL